MEFDLFNIIFIILVAYAAIVGIASLVTGKVYGMGNTASKYTEESLRAFARPWGIMQILVAIAIACFEFLKDPLFSIGDFGVPTGWVCMAVCIILILVVAFIFRNALKEK